jgi:hypothetical protein
MALHRGMPRKAVPADVCSRRITTERKAAHMSTDILKRKLRNFPVANLSLRIAAAS